MSSRARLAGALGVADLLEADLRKPLPSPKRDNAQVCASGYAVSPKVDSAQGCAAGYGASLAPAVSTTKGPGASSDLESKSAASRRAESTGQVLDETHVSPQLVAPLASAPSKADSTAVRPPSHVAHVVSGGEDSVGREEMPHPTVLKHSAQGETSDMKQPAAAGYPRKSSNAGLAKAMPVSAGAPAPVPTEGLATPSAHCTISEGGASEIRTKVFRIGAPLLRSTIPVTVGGRRESRHLGIAPPTTEKADGSDVETILSLSEGECEEEAQLSVTLDFPC
ncbi:unnamed protein product [Symbiodinium necroappetens]|uniref:Uncharacterized protein n=1 Tax=Symbiodinium necroappetens TaxID=1628268 RepID=A0A812W750_9DINO|nr:unnamed protein product [Symbiodinium necroappetens]